MTTNVVPADVVVFADGHDTVASQIKTDATADAAAMAAIISAFGPVGAAFTTALATFQNALVASGSQICDSYRHIGGVLRASAQSYVTTDKESGNRITIPNPTTTV